LSMLCMTTVTLVTAAAATSIFMRSPYRADGKNDRYGYKRKDNNISKHMGALPFLVRFYLVAAATEVR
jgi:hypothetical protein